MQTWDAIRARRNVRQFTSEPVPAEALDRILEAGRRSPSSKNTQPWDFVVVTDREQLTRLAQVWRFSLHVADSAATIALIAPVVEDRRLRDAVQYDLGQVTMSMMIAAADLGIGTAHSSVGEQELAREILGLPPDRECAYLLSVGYPADRPLKPLKNPARRPFDEVVHRGQWRP